MQIGGCQDFREGENAEKLTNGHRVLLWNDRNILELDRGWLHNIGNIPNVTDCSL